MKEQTIANTETAVRMRREGKTYVEIGAVLGLSRGRVWSMVRSWEARQPGVFLYSDRILTRYVPAQNRRRG